MKIDFFRVERIEAVPRLFEGNFCAAMLRIDK